MPSTATAAWCSVSASDGSNAYRSIKPHYYVNDTTVRVGELAGGGGQNWHPATW